MACPGMILRKESGISGLTFRPMKGTAGPGMPVLCMEIGGKRSIPFIAGSFRPHDFTLVRDRRACITSDCLAGRKAKDGDGGKGPVMV